MQKADHFHCPKLEKELARVANTRMVTTEGRLPKKPTSRVATTHKLTLAIDGRCRAHHRILERSPCNRRPHDNADHPGAPNLPRTEQVSYACITAISGTFNPLFKVLCTFPSRYLFAIGLESIFSFGWNVPPTLRSHLREHDSENTARTRELHE